MKAKRLMSTALALVFAVILGLFTGCFGGVGGTEVDEETLDLNVDKNITATLRIAVKNDPTEINAMQKVQDGFNKVYPNVKFDRKPITDYESTIMGDVASGMTYDIMWAADSYVTLFADSDLLQNLDPFIRKSGFDTSLYYDSLIKLGQYKHSGSQYFLPRDTSKIVVYLNKAVFAQYGVQLPDNDWTWEDYKATCKALYDAGCNYAANSQYVMEAELDWRIQMYGITSSFGGTMLDANGEPVFDDNFIAGLEEMQNLVKSGYARFSKTEQQNFVSNRVAMRWQVRPAAMSYSQTLKENLAVVAFPTIESGVEGAVPCCGTGTTGYGIGKTSTQKELAWKFLEYMMSEEGQINLSQSGLIVPSLKSLAEDPEADWRKAFPDLNGDAFIYEGTHDVIPDFYDCLDSVYMSGYDAAVVNMLHNVFGDTSKSVRTRVNTCKQEIATFRRQQG